MKIKVSIRIEAGSHASDYTAESEVPEWMQAEPHKIYKSQITAVAQDLFSSIPLGIAEAAVEKAKESL